jgi:hypothetical protein
MNFKKLLAISALAISTQMSATGCFDCFRFIPLFSSVSRLLSPRAIFSEDRSTSQAQLYADIATVITSFQGQNRSNSYKENKWTSYGKAFKPGFFTNMNRDN